MTEHAKVDSPNWFWEKLGYTVTRRANALGMEPLRIITDQDGLEVSRGAGYDEELKTASRLWKERSKIAVAA